MATATIEYGPALREYAVELLRHHGLPADGGEELDAVEDRMTDLWPTLTADEQTAARGISSDLNWLRRGCVAPAGRGRGETPSGEAERLERYYADRDFDSLLELLRDYTAAIPVGRIAIYRAECYAALGLPDLASLFAAVPQPTGTASVNGRHANPKSPRIEPAGAQ